MAAAPTTSPPTVAVATSSASWQWRQLVHEQRSSIGNFFSSSTAAAAPIYSPWRRWQLQAARRRAATSSLAVAIYSV